MYFVLLGLWTNTYYFYWNLSYMFAKEFLLYKGYGSQSYTVNRFENRCPVYNNDRLNINSMSYSHLSYNLHY